MLPELTVDKEFVDKNWNDEDSRKYVKSICEAVALGKLEDGIPVYRSDDNWLEMGVYKEAKKFVPLSDYFEYGYCDNEDALRKYLQPLIDLPDERYYVHVYRIDMDYEKYYKNGSYINKDGVDTETDYYEYIDEHPEMKIEQEWPGKWLAFTIRKIAE